MELRKVSVSSILYRDNHFGSRFLLTRREYIALCK